MITHKIVGTSVLGALMAAFLGACTQPVPASQYARALGDDAAPPASVWALYASGKNVIVDGDDACARTLLAREPKTLANAEPASEKAGMASIWTIDEATVHPATDTDAGWLGLRVSHKGKGQRWIALGGGQTSACVLPSNAAVEAAFAGEGATFEFTPWKASCARLEATGDSVDAVFVKSDAGVVLEHGGVVLGPRSAASGRAEDRVPWVRVSQGAMRVRADVFRDCFTQKGSPPDAARPDVTALLHVEPSRCTRSIEAKDESHVACTSTVGVWEGIADDKRVSLRLVHRTLGRVDFLGSSLVTGTRWASTVASVATKGDGDPRHAALYETLDRRVVDVVSHTHDVRIARPDDPGLTHRVTVEAKHVTVGDVVAKDTQATSSYKTGERQVPNPAKARAQGEVSAAEGRVRQAEGGVGEAERAAQTAQRRIGEAKEGVTRAREQYQRDRETQRQAVAAAKEAKQTCLNACNGYSGALERSNCRSLCEVGGTVGTAAVGMASEPSRDGIEKAEAAVHEAEQNASNARDGIGRAKQTVESAKRDVETARQREREIPPTVTEDVMTPWPYTKKVYTRDLAATVVLTVRHKDGKETKKEIPVRAQWTDYEVAADPAHNVAPHTADARALSNSTATLPLLGERITGAAGEALAHVLADAQREEMLRAFGDANGERSPDYELVDAAAYGVAGSRISRVVRRGAVEVGTSPFRVPTPPVALAQGECVLAVASVDRDDRGATLHIKANGGAFADARGGTRAAVELCARDVGARGVDDVVVVSTRPARVQWTLYATKTGATAPAMPIPSSAGTVMTADKKTR